MVGPRLPSFWATQIQAKSIQKWGNCLFEFYYWRGIPCHVMKLFVSDKFNMQISCQEDKNHPWIDTTFCNNDKNIYIPLSSLPGLKKNESIRCLLGLQFILNCKLSLHGLNFASRFNLTFLSLNWTETGSQSKVHFLEEREGWSNAVLKYCACFMPC